MKRKTVSILIIALFILSVFSGCNDKLTRGDFEYIFYGEGDKREADIVGLTPDGMKKKILVVPKRLMAILLLRFGDDQLLAIFRQYGKQIN